MNKVKGFIILSKKPKEPIYYSNIETVGQDAFFTFTEIKKIRTKFLGMTSISKIYNFTNSGDHTIIIDFIENYCFENACKALYLWKHKNFIFIMTCNKSSNSIKDHITTQVTLDNPERRSGMVQIIASEFLNVNLIPDALKTFPLPEIDVILKWGNKN